MELPFALCWVIWEVCFYLNISAQHRDELPSQTSCVLPKEPVSHRGSRSSSEKVFFNDFSHSRHSDWNSWDSELEMLPAKLFFGFSLTDGKLRSAHWSHRGFRLAWYVAIDNKTMKVKIVQLPASIYHGLQHRMATRNNCCPKWVPTGLGTQLCMMTSLKRTVTFLSWQALYELSKTIHSCGRRYW